MSNKKVENKDIKYHAKQACAAALIGTASGFIGYLSKEITKFCKNKINDFFDI